MQAVNAQMRAAPSAQRQHVRWRATGTSRLLWTKGPATVLAPPAPKLQPQLVAPVKPAPAVVVTPPVVTSPAVAPLPVSAPPKQPDVYANDNWHEESRRFHRSLYDHTLWQKHRSPFRLFDRLAQAGQSHILRNVVPALVWVGGLASLLVWYQGFLSLGVLPGWPSFLLNAPCQAFISNTSVALSLLLVFRTNSCYGRWDEARKMWGGLLNRSRDLIRQATILMPEQSTAEKEALGRWIITFARCLRIHFQPETTWDAELANILKPAELELLKKGGHKPVIAIQAISNIIKRSTSDPVHIMHMSQNLTFFHDVLGGCERLLRAPIPVSYTRHTARFLFLWLSLLPFALYPVCAVWTIPVSIGIAGVLLGIEEIAMQCEEPFGILPLSALCDRIQDSVNETLGKDQAINELLEAHCTTPKPPAARAPAVTHLPLHWNRHMEELAAGVHGFNATLLAATKAQQAQTGLRSYAI